MRPDDDMKLAKLLKGKGFKQDVASGAGLVSVEWHRTVRGAVRGLSKSIFPALDYRLSPVALAVPLLVLTNVFPFAGLLFTYGSPRALPGLNVALIVLPYACLRGEAKKPSHAAPSRRAPPHQHGRLCLRRSALRLHHARQRRHRMAGHEVPVAGVEGEPSLIP